MFTGLNKLIFAIFSYFLFFIFLNPISAQETGWKIDSFNSDIKIKESGVVSVVETIGVDYGNLNKHGIFRDIPYQYINENGSIYFTKVVVDSVRRDQRSEKYSTNYFNGLIQVKVGNADKTISGKHQYRISYEITGVILPYDNFDELYWNVTGNDWGVPITNTSAKVTLPKDSIMQSVCYEGVFGSSEKCLSSGGERVANFSSSRSLFPKEGLTIAVSFGKNTVPILTATAPKQIFEAVNIKVALALALTFSFLGVFAVYLRWLNIGRDFRYVSRNLFRKDGRREVIPFFAHETIVVEYEPPDRLRPAEIGVLVDEKANTLDVSATIIDLATRKYLKIVEISKKWTFGKTDYELVKLHKDQSELLPYEKLLYEKLFEGKEKVKMSSLKNKFYKSLKEVKKELYKSVVERKLFPTSPEKVRRKYLIFAIVLLVLGLVSFPLGISNMLRYTDTASFYHYLAVYYFYTFGIAFVLSGLALLIFSRFMPRRTAHGREMYRRAKGYHLFIEKAEKHRQKFFEDKNLFNEIMPYAIVFGLVNKFAKAMKDMGIKPESPSWYSGQKAFNMAVFSKSLNSFSKSMSLSIASSPRSSGSGGGGFSGGGLGGGGGGSW